MAKESICSAGFLLHYRQSGVFVPFWEFKPGFGSSLKTLILKVNLLRLKSVKLVCFLGVSTSQKNGAGVKTERCWTFCIKAIIGRILWTSICKRK